MSDFFENYKHPLWQKKRLEIMQAAGFRCQDCGSEDDTLNVHHAYYIKGNKPWEYPGESLRCLCETCHKERHAKLEALRYIVGLLPPQEVDQVIGYAKGVFLYPGPGPHKHGGIAGHINWYQSVGVIHALMWGFPDEALPYLEKTSGGKMLTREMMDHVQQLINAEYDHPDEDV